MLLTDEEARVLGSLVEKQLTTPDQYPLTIKSLLAACNQASNRDPVVDYDEITVMAALDGLKAQRLIRFVLPSHGRTAVRYRHVLDEALGLDARQSALLAVLMLRGPQTVGELRVRTERMANFDGLEEIDHELTFLAAVADPLTMSLGRRPGQKEERWATLLLAPPVVGAATGAASSAGPAGPAGETFGQAQRFGSAADRPSDGVGADASDILGDLRSEIAALRAEVADLRRDLDDLRNSLGG